MPSPYEGLPERSYWKTGVVERHALAPGDVYQPKFAIGQDDRVATAGSCFAQHIARHLRASGFTVLDEEPAPPGLSPAGAARFGYGLYSARYGNIYTARQLRQLVREALGEFEPAHPVWTARGRCHDAQRPSVEPQGLGSAEEVAQHRRQHLEAVRRILRGTDVFIFTLGLTETWEDRATGTVYPTAPGTIAGAHDPAVYAFRNAGFVEVLEDMRWVFDCLGRFNPDIRMLLTVSPVPLTATATDEHVLVASTYSKSVLRAVAGQLASEHPRIAYFPSYELVAGSAARSCFFDNNLRTVNAAGVEVVMRTFLEAHRPPPRDEPAEPAPRAARAGGKGRPGAGRARARAQEDVQCEDALLEAFAR